MLRLPLTALTAAAELDHCLGRFRGELGPSAALPAELR